MLECAFGKGILSDIVNFVLGGGLWVTHLHEKGLQGDSVLSIYVGGTYFGLVR